MFKCSRAMQCTWARVCRAGEGGNPHNNNVVDPAQHSLGKALLICNVYVYSIVTFAGLLCWAQNGGKLGYGRLVVLIIRGGPCPHPAV